MIASAATNGHVVLWNLQKSGRTKQEQVYSDHKRTVNKVSVINSSRQIHSHLAPMAALGAAALGKRTPSKPTNTTR